MLAVKITLGLLSVLVIAQTAISFVRTRAWWVRIFDFPRAQIAVSSAILFGLFGLANLGIEEAGAVEWVLFAGLGLATVLQVVQMLPYTPLWKHQVPDAREESGETDRLRLVVSNVRMDNRSIDLWLATVRAANPHLLVVVEVDDWWDGQLRVLARDYPHQIRQPQNNTYGMAIYSRFPLHKTSIKHLVESTVPSVFTAVELPSGRHVRCAVIHPRPPRPDIQQDSDLRDAELVRAAKIVSAFKSPVVVAGDLNDVAWSHTTHLFQRIARVLDPRIGRGVYATYHADHRLMRYPLDHVFHSNHFALVKLERLAHVGSDHFPILVELALHAGGIRGLEADPPNEADEEEAINAVQDAQELREKETAQERHERQLADK